MKSIIQSIYDEFVSGNFSYELISDKYSVSISFIKNVEEIFNLENNYGVLK